MLILAYDCETTGLIRGSDYTNPANPYLASIAMLLYDDEAHRVIASFNAPIYPDGWAMPEEASAVNGLTIEYLKQVGIPAEVAIKAAVTIMYKADLHVAHNVDFDTKIIAASMWRHLIMEGMPEKDCHDIVNDWLSKPTYCTMKESKPIVNALTANGRLKYPKLSEAYRHFFDREIDNAHSANADTVAVLEIYLALQREIKE
jgi:DNA polymerase-3 subunit epsilon